MTLKKNLVAKYAVRFNKSKKIKSKKQKLKDRNKKHKNVTDESSMDETPRWRLTYLLKEENGI